VSRTPRITASARGIGGTVVIVVRIGITGHEHKGT
jgi:hypothetical protein